MIPVKSQKTFVYGLLKQAVSTCQISRQDHIKLSALLLSPAALTQAERECIHHIFDEIDLGTIQLLE